MPTPLSEQALIDRAHPGDIEAFETVARIHSARVYGALPGFGLESDEADEVAQEMFLRAWRGLNRFEGRAAVEVAARDRVQRGAAPTVAAPTTVV